MLRISTRQRFALTIPEKKITAFVSNARSAFRWIINECRMLLKHLNHRKLKYSDVFLMLLPVSIYSLHFLILNKLFLESEEERSAQTSILFIWECTKKLASAILLVLRTLHNYLWLILSYHTLVKPGLQYFFSWVIFLRLNKWNVQVWLMECTSMIEVKTMFCSLLSLLLISSGLVSAFV